MRDSERLNIVRAAISALQLVEQRLLKARKLNHDWTGCGYPSGSGMSSDIGHARGVGDPVGIAVASALESGRPLDEFLADRTMADAALKRVKDGTAFLERFVLRNTEHVERPPDEYPVNCENPSCGRVITRVGNDVPRNGLCNPCRLYAMRHDGELPQREGVA